jgi:excisionase family DNA binding protein
MRRELESALTLATDLPAEELPELIGQLEQIRIVALARITTPAVQTRPDELLTVDQAARRLNLSRSYLYHHHEKKFKKFARKEGGKLLFSSKGLNDYLQRAR